MLWDIYQVKVESCFAQEQCIQYIHFTYLQQFVVGDVTIRSLTVSFFIFKSHIVYHLRRKKFVSVWGDRGCTPRGISLFPASTLVYVFGN